MRSLIDKILIDQPENPGDPPAVEPIGNLRHMLSAAIDEARPKDRPEPASPVLPAFVRSRREAPGATPLPGQWRSPGRCLRRTVLGAILAVGVAVSGGGDVRAQAARPKPPPAPWWEVTLTQIDKAGTLVGEAKRFPCTPTGCEQQVLLDVEGRPVQFLASFTFVPKGAYMGIQSMQPTVKKVVEFEIGFVGPIFLPAKPGVRFSRLVKFILVGSALAESEASSPQLMPNQTSNVFHRKVVPDMVLRVELETTATPDTKAR